MSIDPSTVHVGLLRAVLTIPGARTLKDRRQVVLSLKDRIAHRFPVSCHEIERSDHPARAELLVTTGGLSSAVVRQALDRIRSMLESQGSCVITDVRVQVLAWSGGVADGWQPPRGEDDV